MVDNRDIRKEALTEASSGVELWDQCYLISSLHSVPLYDYSYCSVVVLEDSVLSHALSPTNIRGL